MKRCNICGASVKKNALFCHMCGSDDLTDIKKKKHGRFSALFKALLCAVYFLGIQLAVTFVYSVALTVLAMSRMNLEGDVLFEYISVHMSRNAASISIASNVAAVAILMLIFFAKGRSIKKELGFRRFSPSLIPLCAILGYAMQYAVGFITALIPWPEYFIQSHEQSTSAAVSGNLILAILGVALVTGIAEEIVFRALAIDRLGRAFGGVASVIFSAVIFGAAHLQLLQIFYATLLGLLLGAIYRKFRSVWPCAITHMSFNLAAILGLPSASPILTLAVIGISIGAVIITLYLIFTKDTVKTENKSI